MKTGMGIRRLCKSAMIIPAIIGFVTFSGCDEKAYGYNDEPSGQPVALPHSESFFNTSVDTESLEKPDEYAKAFQGTVSLINSSQKAVDILGQSFIDANRGYADIDYNSQSLIVWTLPVPQCYSHVQLNFVGSYVEYPDKPDYSTIVMKASFMKLNGSPTSTELMTVRIGVVSDCKLSRFTKITVKPNVYEK